ncbi:MAG: enoyl-CoA hydratase/isomerase family protein [Deltaproteobacteria bacterium]|nr:enoyl-CoA hydratase/isomerase family protein [Deltaproteobacteria bacterium]
MYKTISVEEKWSNQVIELRLNVPPANILTKQMMDELEKALAQAVKVRTLKALVIAAQGQHFSFGASVEEHLPGKVNEMLPAFHRLIGLILESPVPTFAKVSGLCLGGGFELAIACSFVFADETAKFAVPEIQIGVFPPVAAALLPGSFPMALVHRMILTGTKVGADELFRHGLIHSVSKPGSLESDCLEYLQKEILPKSASSLRLAHHAIQMTRIEHYKKVIGRLEEFYLKQLMATEDAVEGIQSFIEKRSPKWRDA